MTCRVWSALFALAALAAPARADDGFLRFLPSDSKMVVIVNVPALGDEDQKTVLDLVRRLYSGQMVPELKNLDKLPISELKQVVFAQPHLGGFTGLVILRGKVDAKLLDQQMSEAGKAITVEKMGDPKATVYQRSLDEKMFLEIAPDLEKVPAFVRRALVPGQAHLCALDEQTLIVALGGRAGVERALRARPEKSKPRTPEELTKLLKDRDKKDLATTVLMDGCLHPGVALIVPQETRDAFELFEYVVVRTQGGKTVKSVITATAKSKDDAATLEKTAKAGIDTAQKGLEVAIKDEDKRKILESLLKSFKVSRKDETVTATAQLSDEDARKLVPKGKKK
jgi:hypothetical protein